MKLMMMKNVFYTGDIGRMCFLMKNKTIKTIFCSLGIVIALTLINCVLLVLSYCLPTFGMRKHVADSAPMIALEELYPRWDWQYTTTQVDGQSEYDLFGMAINEDSEGTPIEKAMFMWYPDGENLPRDEGVAEYAKKTDMHYDQRPYTRYWNGSVLFLKVLLMFFTACDVRMINFMVELSILLVIIWLMTKKGLDRFLVPFIATMIFVNPFTMAISVKYSAEYIPMLLAIIVILLFGDRIDKIIGGWNIFFAIVGAITAFLSMMSFPGITLGIPLLMLIWVHDEKNVIKTVVVNSIYWVGAYAVAWSMKWLIGTIVTDYNFLKDAISQIFGYHSEGSVSILVERIMRNLWPIYNPVYVLFFLCVVLITVVVSVKQSKSRSTSDEFSFDAIIGYGLLILMPLAIIIGMGNGYAYVHFYMAHRHFAIAVGASLCVASYVVRTIISKTTVRH